MTCAAGPFKLLVAQTIMATVPPQPQERKPDTFSTNGGNTHVEIALQSEDFGNGTHAYVVLTVDTWPSLLTPSTARAMAKSLMVWASLAEARRARHGQDMPPTGQGEAPR